MQARITRGDDCARLASKNNGTIGATADADMHVRGSFDQLNMTFTDFTAESRVLDDDINCLKVFAKWFKFRYVLSVDFYICSAIRAALVSVGKTCADLIKELYNFIVAGLGVTSNMVFCSCR
jgi:hypothetical protein